MENYGFGKTMSNYCVFVKKFGDNDSIFLFLYVDDILIVGQDASKIDNMKKEVFCNEGLRTNKTDSWHEDFLR